MRLFCLARDVLGSEANSAVYQKAVACADLFEQSRVAHRGVDLDTRASRVVYGDRLGELTEALERAVRARLVEAVDLLGIPPFEISAFEIQMTSHNDGDFFDRHTDNASQETASRALTFVYYFHTEPPRFSGGELVFVDRDGRESVVEPGNDTLVLFDPRTTHEVRRITCPSGRFADGRFTLNGWLHRPAAAPRPGTFFDQRIFTSVGRWAAPAPRVFRGSAAASTRHRVGQSTSASGVHSGHEAALLELYGDLHRTSPHHDEIDVRHALTGARFLDEYYARNTPVLLPGVLGDSEALRTWSPEYFATDYGHVPVQITSGREQSTDYERRFGETVHTVTMKEFADRLTSSSESNDFYLVARNNFFDNPGLRELRDDLHPPEDIVDDSDRRPGSAKLWVGPRGTVTPLHYDEHSILFSQVYGSKQFKLIPSFDLRYLYARDAYYSEVDPEDVDPVGHPLFARASVIDIVVEPGDGLFIPAGWWHWARSLSVSISATFSSFAWPWVNTSLTNHLS